MPRQELEKQQLSAYLSYRQLTVQQTSLRHLSYALPVNWCIQITGDLADYAEYTGNLKILSVYGGASIDNQIRGLKKGVHIIVATPGRLIDLIGRGVVKLATVSTVILDEADEMLNMGFLDSINEILDEVPAGRKRSCFPQQCQRKLQQLQRSI